MSLKILIIKLGAKGDVVRTLPILEALKEKYPDSSIDWVTKDNISDLFNNNQKINKIFVLPCNINQEYDLLFNFDIEQDATKLAEKVKAKKKYGFFSKDGFPSAFNLASEYYLNTLFDDELKKSNKKTYQEMMFEAAELNYQKQPINIYLTEEEKEFGNNFIEKNKINKEKLIGIHLGSAPRWPSKAWHEEELKKFILLASKAGHQILLFGGPDEIDKHNKIIKEMRDKKITIFENNPRNSNREFFTLVNLCSLMLCGDSFALHVALAFKKPTIGLFFCTSPDEVEDYGLLKKVVSPMLYDFFPERMNEYNEELVKSIKAEKIFKLI